MDSAFRRGSRHIKLRSGVGTVLADIAHSRAEIDQGRLLVLAAARQIDLHGAKKAMKDIGIAKVSRTVGLPRLLGGDFFC